LVPPAQQSALSRSAEQMGSIARNDPNNIFNALTLRMGQLELNQTLTSNWLTLWQNRITSQIKVLNSTQNDTAQRLRGVHTEVSALQTALSQVREIYDFISEQRQRLGQEADSVNSSVSALQRELRQLASDNAETKRQFAAQLEAMQATRHFELACCVLLTLGLALAFFLACTPQPSQPAHRHTRHATGVVVEHTSNGQYGAHQDSAGSESDDDPSFALPDPIAQQERRSSTGWPGSLDLWGRSRAASDTRRARIPQIHSMPQGVFTSLRRTQS